MAINFPSAPNLNDTFISGNITYKWDGTSWDIEPGPNVSTVNGISGDVTLDTDNISEGVTNKYYSTSLFNTDFTSKSTTDLSEGTNLYYTEGRVSANTDVSGNTTARSTYLTSFNGISQLVQLDSSGKLPAIDGSALLNVSTVSALDNLSDVTITTPVDNQFLRYTGTAWINETVSSTDITEGTNLYYTEARVSANSSVAANTAKVGITTQQSNDIIANNAKISYTDSADVAANTTHRTNLTNPHSVTKAQVGLGNVDNTSDANKPVSTAQQTALDAKADLVGGLVPSSQLPSFVDDVLEYATQAGFPATGESGKIYIDLSTDDIFRWSGTVYVQISDVLSATDVKSLYESNADTNVFTDAEKTNLGTNTTHTGLLTNPHSVTKTQVGLGNVDNTSDLNKPISTATQTALDGKLSLTGGTLSGNLLFSTSGFVGSGVNTSDTYIQYGNSLIMNTVGDMYINRSGLNQIILSDTALTVSEHILPPTDNTFDIGSIDNGWATVYATDVKIGATHESVATQNYVDSAISSSTGDFKADGSVPMTGNLDMNNTFEYDILNLGRLSGSDTITDSYNHIQMKDIVNDSEMVIHSGSSSYIRFTGMNGADKVNMMALEYPNMVMYNNKITSLGEPTISTDAATKNYVDVAIAGVVSGGGGDFLADGSVTMTGSLNLGGNNLYNARYLTYDPNNQILTTANYIDLRDGTSNHMRFNASSASSNFYFQQGGNNIASLSETGITFFNADAPTPRISNLADPVSAQDAATKAYVDSQSGAVTSVNTLTGAVVLDTDDISEGVTNKYADANATNQGNTFNGVNQLLQLDGSGLVPSANLPSYVDDVIEGYLDVGDTKLNGYDAFYEEALLTTLITGESGKIYIDLNTNDTYRWTGSLNVKVSDVLSGSEVKSLYEGNADTNAFTDALLTKLTGIESNATADQTGAEIKAAYEAEADTNAFTDAYKSEVDANTLKVGADANATNQGNVFNGNSQLVQTTADGKLPILDGSNLTNLSNVPSTTDDLAEGATNLYYTEARVSANADVAANTAKVSYTDAAVDTRIGLASIKDLSDVFSTMTPTDGQVLTYDTTNGWQAETAASGGASVTTSDIAPVSPVDGDLWWDSTVGVMKVYYEDADSSQWVDATPAGSGASTLNELEDTDLATVAPADGDLLSYDSASGNWVPYTLPPAAGGAEVYVKTGTMIGQASAPSGTTPTGYAQLSDDWKIYFVEQSTSLTTVYILNTQGETKYYDTYYTDGSNDNNWDTNTSGENLSFTTTTWRSFQYLDDYTGAVMNIFLYPRNAGDSMYEFRIRAIDGGNAKVRLIKYPAANITLV